MKLKKLLALVLAVIMCASLFTVVPTTVSAAGASEWQNFYSEADGGFRDTRPDSDATPPEGYERIGVTKDAKSTQVTKEKYDLTETTFVLRDLYFSQTGSDWANIVFANDQITGKRQTKTNESNGTLSMFVRKTDSGIKFTVYTSSGGEETISTIADATEFEIGLVKLTATDGSSVYRLRVNNTYSSSTKTSNIYTIVNTFAANSTGSYVSVSANGKRSFGRK